MLVDTDAIRAHGRDCLRRADDLSAAAAALKSVPDSGASAAFGPVGARFLATLADAVTDHARAVIALSDDLTAAHFRSGAVAEAYAAADRRGSRLL